MTSKWAMGICVAIAALIVLPQALAASVGFSGAAGSTVSTFSSALGTGVDTKNTLTAQNMASSGSVMTDWGAGAIEQYFAWNSWDGEETAATFAYADDSSKYKYSVSGTSAAHSASAAMSFYGEDLVGFTLGGFAYNPDDYAMTYVAGTGAETMTYKNSLSASASKVSASETFSGDNFEGVTAKTFAYRGTDEMPSDQTEIEDWIAGGSYDWVAADNTLYSSQFMSMDGGSISSKTPYKASASLASDTASSSQSVTLAGDDAKSTVSFDNFAASGDDSTGYQAETYLMADGITSKAKNLVYSSSNKATETLATATQTKNIKVGANATSYAYSVNFGEALTGFQQVDLGTSTSAALVKSSMSGTDTATTKVGSASTTQKLTASAANVTRFVDSYQGLFGSPDGYFAEAYTDIAIGTATKANTISGTSVGTATADSVGIVSSGNWKAGIAKNAIFTRTAYVSNGYDLSTKTEPTLTPTALLTHLWKENDKATETTVTSS